MDEKDGYTWWDKKNSRSRSAATGREDGDEEFAREVYNVLSKCSQCPSRLAVSTMLPSHQAHMSDPGLTLSRQKLAERAAARAAGTSRRKPSEAGRFEPTGYGSMIRATKSHVIDVVDNVADDDDDDDELAHWKKMMTVRGMVAPLSIKRRFRSRLMLASVHKLKGFAGWKHRRGMGWKRLKASMMEHFVNLAVWRSHFKTIEGHFGTGVLSYFIFLNRHRHIVSAGKGLQVRLVSSGDQFFMYCAKVLNGWDYSIGDERAADLCHRNLYFELAGELRQERRAMQRKAQTCCKKFKMYAVRAIANVCVCVVLGAAGYAIYRASDESLKFSGGDDTHSPYLVLLMQFLPSLTITAVSVVVPTIFATIVVAEDYSPEFEIRITLIR
ncbi:PREDICTED: transmembrane channel-like protein 7 [Priapulus caudatus]|uniref:Transmembrane channel-like protein 7 n=1 Tax=Priapulus caudatus TaxID=37621 RepID=A0ABM1EXQ0_PRICU|nr:PREDICTED: transmembrane channel-like protein 7 [Priapulus caudatus]